ncbi:chromosome-associated kinesin KIF4 [Drosophila elegans]|uniref:chromosome-associated kinesin KIF4 n=1 Tax=Drosophila elegans TaxID=30023 RepID=UPI0007E790A6|nr:chromosome-associated kinesin KIF4 [Drosophila elegans]
MSFEDPSSVAVALRVRPLVQSELDRGCRIAVERSPDGSPQVTVNRTESYTYNHVFDSGDSQKDIFESCVEAKMKKFLSGYNVTILAYGQTGSGKTYTMGTAFNGVLDDDVGVIPRAVHNIFLAIEEMRQEFRFVVTCSFVELYQEQFYDLFSTQKREKATVDIREVKNRVVMPGLTELEVKSAQEVTEHLMRGSAGRAVAATAMNETSSRSHAIFTLTLEATKLDGKQSVTTSRFNLVDLAGSERCSKTLASGDRFKEGVNINKGLLALGNVINALGSNQAAGYIPYRQSKLTRLLQDSLGGNSITLMIACVSPADYNVAETLSTLRYADRALQIKNKPVVNVDPHAAEVNRLKDIIQKLRIELLGGGKMTSSISSAVGDAGLGPLPTDESFAGSMASAAEIKRLREQVRSQKDQIKKLQQELHHTLVDLTEKEMRAHIVEQAHDKIRSQVLQLKGKLDPQQDGDGDADGQDRQREISQLIELVDNEFQRTQAELESQDQETIHQQHLTTADSGHSHSERDENGGPSSGGDEANEMLQSHSEEFTNKQLNFAGELRSINRQLNIKQELHERITRNYSQLEDGNEDAKLRECNQKIDDLEAERRNLMDQLRNMKSKETSAKIAEERRKRLQQLEQEISDLRRKLLTQANMLKMREKEREKIQNLSGEIRAMKESKVKLIRAMRGESEKFRQWKMLREKELTQLKSKDRKMQSEILRQQTLHTKQRQVLKRKCDEALAANKRLKEALERQASAQTQRYKYAKDHGGSGSSAVHSMKTDSWVDREVEIILSLIDAEHSLEQLMEDRAVINNHYQMMQQERPNDPAEAQAQARLLANLEEELEMRNAQIADLQQKVCPTDLDSRIRSVAEGVQSIGESRLVNKQLLKTLVQQRRQQVLGRTALDEQRSQLLEAQEQQLAATTRLRLAQVEHEEQMLALQRAYEEKVAVLIRTANQRSAGCQPPAEVEQQRQQILEELLSSREALQQELDALKANTKSKVRVPKVEPLDADESVIMVEDNELSILDSDSDPEWKPLTSKYKTRQTTSNRNLSQQQQSQATVPRDDQEDASATSAGNASTQSLNSTQVSEDGKRGRGCRCRKKCNSRRCGCFVGSIVCVEGCVCKGRCHNPINLGQQPPPENAKGDDSHSIMSMEIKENDEEDIEMADNAEDDEPDNAEDDEPDDAEDDEPDNAGGGEPDEKSAKENVAAFSTSDMVSQAVDSPQQSQLDQKNQSTPVTSGNGALEDFDGCKLTKMSGLAFATPRRKFF